MKKENHQFPALTNNERLNLLGYARFMGYEFDYNPDKKKAVLVKTTNEERKVLYIAKIQGKLVGIDNEGNEEILTSQMNISKKLHHMGIFKIPENVDIGINDYILQTLKLIGVK